MCLTAIRKRARIYLFLNGGPWQTGALVHRRPYTRLSAGLSVTQLVTHNIDSFSIGIVGGCHITGMCRIWQHESSESARVWESDRGEQVNGSLRYLLQLCTCFCLFFAAHALTSLAGLWLRLWLRLHLHFDLLLPCLLRLVEFCMWRVQQRSKNATRLG